jgi:Zn-dependent peptidase ImmA (M78 family)
MVIKSVAIKPIILLWARQSRGIKIGEVVSHFETVGRKKYKINDDLLKKLETSEDRVEIQFTLLKELAEFYKRPISAFFLDDPLDKKFIPKSFRTILSKTGFEFSKEAYLVFDRVRNSQEFIIEAKNELGIKLSFPFKKYLISDDVHKLSEEFRNKFSLEGLPKEVNIKTDKMFFNYLREKIESFGVLVFRKSFPLEDGRAFCFVDKEPYIITLNSQDGDLDFYGSKIFSLVHEFAHILLRDDSVENNSFFHKKKEQFCNAFAANFLVPNEIFKNQIENISIGSDIDVINKLVVKLTNKFFVSRPVILRKLLDLNLISSNLYQDILEKWEEKYKEKSKKKFAKSLPPEVSALNNNGRLFSEFIINAENANLLTKNDAANLLGIKDVYFESVRDALI